MAPTIDGLTWQAKNRHMGGEQPLVTFPNGYGASVLRGGMAYTSDGTYEIAVLHNGDICHDTPITSDVLGYLTEVEANETLAAIEALPAKSDQASSTPGGTIR